MGFFNNIKNLKDQALENEKIQNYEQLQGLFDAIDNQAEKEKEKDKKEREYFESLTPEQKVEYKRIKKRNKNLKKLGMYGLTAASMATGVGVPVMMAANVGSMISDDNMTFNKDQHDAKMKKMSGQKKRPQAKPNKAKTKKVPLISIKYDKKGQPKVQTFIDKDWYNINFRYAELIREKLLYGVLIWFFALIVKMKLVRVNFAPIAVQKYLSQK